MRIQRAYYQNIKKRLEEPRRFIQVLYGARQVGKTTLIRQILDDIDIPYLFETADEIEGFDSVWLKKLWNRARQKLKQSGAAEFLLVVDEVQKISNWSEIVKKEWDDDTFESVPLKVVLLGSSSLLIQRGLTESLAGRFETIPIPHWSYQEMRDAFGFTVDQYIWFGGYPGPAELINDEMRWKRYVKTSLVDTSLTRDVLLMNKIEKPALLRRLFEIGASYSAHILSLNKVQGELMERGNLTTLSDYLRLLDYAGLLCGLEKYCGDIIRKRASQPKFQVYNNALMSYLSEKTFGQAKADSSHWGRMFESAVGAHLLNCSFTDDYNVLYWNEGSREVDYVIQKGSRLVAIEVKSGIDSANFGMAIFDKKFHPDRMYNIGTDGIPMEDFLLMNPSDLF